MIEEGERCVLRGHVSYERETGRLTDSRTLALGHCREELWVLMAFIACPCGVGAQGIVKGGFWCNC